ncbi:MAG: hypothetical protein J2P18_14700, partial [Nocardia sp.]|nr:hypothetical protein [Nocardia sp.]
MLLAGKLCRISKCTLKAGSHLQSQQVDGDFLVCNRVEVQTKGIAILQIAAPAEFGHSTRLVWLEC